MLEHTDAALPNLHSLENAEFFAYFGLCYAILYSHLQLSSQKIFSNATFGLFDSKVHNVLHATLIIPIIMKVKQCT